MYGAHVHHYQSKGFDLGTVTFPTVDFAAWAGYRRRNRLSRLENMEPVRSWVQSGAPGVFIVDVRVNAELIADWLTEAFQAEQR